MNQDRTTRRTRSFSFDPRLAIGIALVIASVACVVAIITAADRTVAVYAAAEALTPGERIRADDLAISHIRLEDADARYLIPGDVPASGLVVIRSVDEGELLPASAIGAAEGLQLTSVVLEIDGTLAAAIAPTALVDVWAARETEHGFGPPVAIVSSATVVRLVETESIVAAGTTAIEVLVPRAKLARVLEALANGQAISVVPSHLPGR